MSSVSSLFPLESSPPTPAMFTRTRTHPCRRHSSGSTISIACTRPGGTVRVSVFARPNFRRRPSGDWVTVKLKYLMNSAKTMMIGRPPVTSAIPRPPQPLLRTVTTTISTVSSSRPAVTVRMTSDSARSRGVTDVIGISGASPTSCRSPAARASTSLRRARASSSGRNWSLTRESPAPATSTVTSAMEKNRANSGWATSTDCSLLSWRRRCCLVMTPESTRKSPSSSNQNHRLRQARYCQPVTSAVEHDDRPEGGQGPA